MTGNVLKALPVGPARTKRHGGEVVWEKGGIRVTMTLEAIPGKPFQPNLSVPVARRMDTLLVKYAIENTSNASHKVGCRTLIDTLIVNNDQALFASPTTHPKEVLNGVLLQGKAVPNFIEVLERPDLQNPGFKGILTFKFSDRKLEGPSKVVLTNYQAGQRSMGRAANRRVTQLVRYLLGNAQSPAASQREIAFSYGQGIASLNDGRVSAEFGGSFAPASYSRSWHMLTVHWTAKV